MGGSWVGFRPIRLAKEPHYSHIPPFLLTSPTLKCRPHIPSYLWVTLDFWQDNVWPLGRPFLAQIAQNYSFWAKNCVFLADYPISRDIIQKKFTIMPKHQKDNIFVLPRDSLGYGDGILMLEKSVGVQKIMVYGCSVEEK